MLNFLRPITKKCAVYYFYSSLVQRAITNLLATPAAPIILATCTYALPHSKYGSCVREIRGEARLQSAVPSSESQASSQKVAALSHVLRETYANAGATLTSSSATFFTRRHYAEF